MSRSFKILVCLAPLALAACVSPQEDLASDYGVSVRQNLAAQVADPDARYRRTEPPAGSGERTALAQERYVRGEVIQPVTEGTTKIQGASGGGAGAGQSGGK